MKIKLRFIKETSDALFFRADELNLSFDFPKEYKQNEKEFTLTHLSEGYYVDGYRDDDGLSVVFREENKALFLSIEASGEIEEAYILNIIPKTH